jgi:hypothetical protein
MSVLSAIGCHSSFLSHVTLPHLSLGCVQPIRECIQARHRINIGKSFMVHLQLQAEPLHAKPVLLLPYH